jgi:hypothetical protein
VLLQDVAATIVEYTTTDIAAACSIAGVLVKRGSSKQVGNTTQTATVVCCSGVQLALCS